MRSLQRYASTLVLAGMAASVTACGGGSSSPPLTPAPLGQAPASSNAAGGFGYDAAFVSRGHLVGPAQFGSLSFDILLPMRDEGGLKAYAQSVSDPRSGSYRQFLTPGQIADRFGASAADQAKAVAYFVAAGLTVRTWTQRMLVGVTGSQKQLEAAFHTKFGNFRSSSGESFIAPITQPSVAAGIPVRGSANIVVRTKRVIPQFVPAKGGGPGLSPQQIATVFDFNGAYGAGYTGAGISVGIIGTGGIVTSGNGKVGDAEAYKSIYHIAGASTVSIVATTNADPNIFGLYGGFAPPPPVTPPCTTSGLPGFSPSEAPTATCNPEDGEAQIDTEQTASLARDSAIQFFLAYDPGECLDKNLNPVKPPCPAGDTFTALQGLFLSDEEIQTAIAANTADILSLSYGGPEFGADGVSTNGEFNSNGQGFGPTEFATLVTEGIAVFVSSGDQGAEGCFNSVPSRNDSVCVSYPASDPSVVGVGGVTTPVNAAGQLVGPLAIWGLQTSNGTGGSGGGVSAFFPLPAYQKNAAGQPLPGILSANRNVPDASLEGDPQTGVSLLENADKSLGGATIGAIGGTSVSAPEMAAMWALVLQACKQTASCATAGGAKPYRLGNPDPRLYGIYQTAKYTSTFQPITYGNNGLIGSGGTQDPGYNGNPNGGYNQATGIGVPFARALIRAVVGV